MDGGFLKRKLGSASAPLRDAAPLGSLLAAVDALMSPKGYSLHRAYFYDAHPYDGAETNPLSGEKVSFSDTWQAQVNRKLHDDIRKRDHFALRLGHCKFDGWQVATERLRGAGPTLTVSANDLKEDIKQVGVDLRIGIDVATLVLKRQVQAIVLVTADSDFEPVMKMARREGAKVFLVALGHSVDRRMVEHSDVNLSIDPGPLRTKRRVRGSSYPPSILPDGP